MDSTTNNLLADISVLQMLIKENPCGWKEKLIESLGNVVRNIIIQHCIEGASKEQVAKYFHRDTRTITRWQEKYKDFPRNKEAGHKELSYNWLEVIRWKLAHKELFEEA